VIPHILSGDVLTAIIDGTPHQVTKDHRNFDRILDTVQTKEESSASDLRDLIYPARLLRNIAAVEGTELSYDEHYGDFECRIDGKVYEIDGVLSDTIVKLYETGKSIESFVSFIRKLHNNPDQDTAKQLWRFISVCGLCLTPEGNFLAYKNVNQDFTSIHDGDTDNTPGTVLVMPRNCVEKNPNRTCGRGLHFAAWGYLSYYASGCKTVLVSVSPRDVVSIPTDYNYQKGRACRYRIVREVEQPEELRDLALFEEEGTDYDDN